MKLLRLLFGFFALTSCLISTAQAPFTWHCNPNFGDGYPMITFYAWHIDPIQPKDGSESIGFGLGDFIKTINGKDVLTENGFDELNKTGFIEVEYFSWPDQELKRFVFHNDLFNYGKGGGDISKPHTYSFVPLSDSVLPEVSLVKSSNVNFTDYRTYDFLIEGDDPLVDEELLNTFMKTGFITTDKMKRDVDNPDVIFRIAKNTDQTFSTTYVPPTQQVVGTSTTIKPVYNYLTRTTSYKADQKVQTIQKEGHTEVTNVDNIFLEVVALDAKKLNDPNQKTPPEIWKLTYSSQKVNDNRSDIKRYKEILEACDYPFTQPYRLMDVLPLLTGATLVPSDDNKTLRVEEVGLYTPADLLGLEAGDVILKINGKNEIKRIEKDRRGFTLKERIVPLGDLPEQLCEAAFFIITTELHPTEFRYPLKHTTFKNLNKDKDNEFLIERNGKKIKLKGQLWPKEVYDMDTDGFRKWCLYNKALPIIRRPQ